MTEREYVVRYLARDAERYPELSGDELAAYLSQRHGEGGHGGGGRLPGSEQAYRFSCGRKGVWLGEWSHMRKGRPGHPLAGGRGLCAA